MKFVILAALLCSAAFVHTDVLPAEACDPDVCLSPDCRCSSETLDENIPIENTPQLVMLTFDDAVTALIYDEVIPFFGDIVNPDGCPAAVTFYASHEYTDYTKVHKLWAAGHELALHSISHSPYTDYWRNISYENLTMEFGDQIKLMAYFAQIDESDLKGIRLPLFEHSGDKSYEIIAELGLTYDSSWPSQELPAFWPYSLDYLSDQGCQIGNCPTGSIPNVWVLPINDWEDIEGVKCAMVDACRTIPSDDYDELLDWLKTNFHRSYDSNRAPMGVYTHAAWFNKHENHLPAYKELVHYMNSFPDVYITTASRVLDYTRHPRAVDATHHDILDECQTIHEPDCESHTCRLIREDVNDERWMTSCVPCPAVYPWKGNPYGLRHETEPEEDRRR